MDKNVNVVNVYTSAVKPTDKTLDDDSKKAFKPWTYSKIGRALSCLTTVIYLN
ncbi:MAG: hypothetical protein ACJASL_005072 [Paraglaciecola sp.]|jgi:hypothetical protein